MRHRAYTRGFKRGFDIALVIASAPVTLPVLFLVGIVVRAFLGAPVFFRQERPGLHSRPFTLLKFRTMTDQRDATGALFSDGNRLTRVGRVLRSTSLDELPELINVLRGEMSLVGPRPLLIEYLERYSREQARRHDVRPGITGLAQVSGRNALDWESKFRLDVWYVDHCKFTMDVAILARTFVRVFRRQGINRQGHDTTPKFMGTQEV